MFCKKMVGKFGDTPVEEIERVTDLSDKDQGARFNDPSDCLIGRNV